MIYKVSNRISTKFSLRPKIKLVSCYACNSSMFFTNMSLYDEKFWCPKCSTITYSYIVTRIDIIKYQLSRLLLFYEKLLKDVINRKIYTLGFS